MRKEIAPLLAVMALIAGLLPACTSGGEKQPSRPTARPSASPDVVTPTASSPTHPRPAHANNDFASRPTWVQDFSGPLNSGVFSAETGDDGWGNNELQNYTSNNAYTQNGHLVIEARHEGGRYTSARLVTNPSFTPTYGRIVWQGATMPKGVGTWPAFWLYPAGGKYRLRDMNRAAHGDQEIINGEIDVMEYVGAAPREINSSAHAYANHPEHGERSGQTTLPDADSAPHDYWLEWTPHYLQFGVDDRAYYKVQRSGGPAHWPYDQKYFLVTNLAMGGDWGGMNRDQYPPDGIDTSRSRWRLTIDAIKYYPYVG